MWYKTECRWLDRRFESSLVGLRGYGGRDRPTCQSRSPVDVPDLPLWGRRKLTWRLWKRKGTSDVLPNNSLTLLQPAYGSLLTNIVKRNSTLSEVSRSRGWGNIVDSYLRSHSFTERSPVSYSLTEGRGRELKHI